MSADDDWPLHERGLSQKELHHRFGACVVGRVEAELLEPLVFADQLPRSLRQETQDSPQSRAIRRIFEILDDIELDAALAQDLQRAA